MTIRISNSITYQGVTYQPGQIVTLPASDERAFVSAGYAVYVSGGGTVTTPPTIPGPTSASAQSASLVVVTWGASRDNTATSPSYTVYRNGTLAASGVTGTTYSDSSVQPFTTYTYNIVAVGSTGLQSSPSINTVVTTPASGGGGGTADTTRLEGVVMHDGTSGGGSRPPGYARIRWVNPPGAVYPRPTNMAVGDVWEHD